jgi:hypothetical protein
MPPEKDTAFKGRLPAGQGIMYNQFMGRGQALTGKPL